MAASLKARNQYYDALYDQRSGDEFDFDDEGMVPYTLTASVICLRLGKPSTEVCMIHESELAIDEYGGLGVISEFLRNGCFEVASGHEVLVGQSNVIDYVGSSSTSTKFTNYPGEYMFAVLQSRKDETDAKQRTTKQWRAASNTPHNTYQQFAPQALEEEFMVQAPESARFSPLVALQTRKIRGSSNLTVTYIDVAVDESSWLYALDLDDINVQLEKRRKQVEDMIRSGSWDDLTVPEREALCPKMRKLLWLDVKECILAMQGSISWYFLPVNEWQAEEFAFHGLTMRSSMYTSLASLLRIENLGREKLLARAERFHTYAPQEADAELRHLIDVESERFSKNARRLAKSVVSKAAKL